MPIVLGEIEQVIRDVGGDALLQKLAQIDQRSNALGNRVIAMTVTAPGAQQTAQALTNVTGVAGQTARTTLTLGAASQSAAAQQTALVNAILGLTAAVQQSVAVTTAQTAAQRGATAAATAQTAATQAATAATTAQTGATQQVTAALNQAAQAGARVTQNTNNAANAAAGANPKLRSAANGLTALAFAATSANGSFQSMAMAAGLASSSIAAMTTGPIAAWAAGVGAAVTVGAALIGIFEQMTDSAANAATAITSVEQSIRAIRSLNEARAAQVVAARNVERAEADLAIARARASSVGAGGIADAGSLIGDLARLRTAQKALEQFRDIQKTAAKQVAELEITEAQEAQAARLGIITRGTAAENSAREAASDAFLASEAAKFALGQRGLEDFFTKRIAAIRAAGAREEAALRERQGLLAEPVAGATAAQSAERAAEIRAIESEIRENRARTAAQETQLNAQREAERRRLSNQLLQFEQKEQEAAGDASQARIAMARAEAVEVARALVQGGVDPTEAQRRTQEQAAREASAIRFQQSQREAQRQIAGIELERLAIQQRIERLDISEEEGARQLAALERDRLPTMQRIAAEMERFADEAGNPELVAAARRLRAELNGWGVSLADATKRLLSLVDALAQSPLASGREWAEQLREMLKLAEAEGFTITPKIEFAVGSIGAAFMRVQQQLSAMALGIGDAIGTALADGFSAAFTKGSGKNFFEAFGNSLLKGVGQMMVQLGSSMITYGLIMLAAKPLLAFTPFAGLTIGAGTALAAGTALVALGAGMGAIAGNNSGSRTGGGAAAAEDRLAEPQRFRVTLDPDRRLREARERERAGAIGAPSTPTVIAPASIVPQRTNITNVHIGQINSLEPSEPRWQRVVGETMDAWNRRTGRA